MKVWLGVGWLTAGLLSAGTIRIESRVGQGPQVFDEQRVERETSDMRDRLTTSAGRVGGAGAYDFAESLASEFSRSSFTGSVSTGSSRDEDGAEGTFAEADILWLSSPLVVSTLRGGRGFLRLNAVCESGPDFGLCESSLTSNGLMEVIFNEPTFVWFHLNARSVGRDYGVTSVAEAWFTGEVLEAFDESMNSVGFTYQYLNDGVQVGGEVTATPEPRQTFLILASLGLLGIFKAVSQSDLRRRLH